MTPERKSKTDDSTEHPISTEVQTDSQPEADKKEEKKVGMLSNIAKSMSLQYGEDSVVVLKEAPEKATVSDWISTGNYAINWICSGKTASGGLPVGRIVEFFGDPSSGKSLLLAHLFVEAQKRNSIMALFDTEATFNIKFAKCIGLNPDDLLYTRAYRKETKKVKIVNQAGKF